MPSWRLSAQKCPSLSAHMWCLFLSAQLWCPFLQADEWCRLKALREITLPKSNIRKVKLVLEHVIESFKNNPLYTLIQQYNFKE